MKIPKSTWFTSIIGSVSQPIQFFVLMVLVCFIVGLVLTPFLPHEIQPLAINWTFRLLVFIFSCFLFVLVMFHDRFKTATATANPAARPSAVEFKKPPDPPKAPDEWQNVLGADGPAPPINTWIRELRPTLHQASYYSIPTYYLDRDLHIVDVNAAFDIIFRRISGKLVGRHVNWFINELQNKVDVFREAQRFTEEVAEKQRFPYVHLEPIVYESDDFGKVEFTKVASQLHDSDGHLRGWAVALMPRMIEWSDFEPILKEALDRDKLWSVYAGPYDRILPDFPPYIQLIDEVISVVPSDKSTVGDLGAGTGVVSQRLLAKGHRVVAIENSVGMLDRLTQNLHGNPNLTVVKASIENLKFLKDALFDAVTMVNVLYAVENPIGCLREVNRILRPGGVVGISTTHRETLLDDLLIAIKVDLEKRKVFQNLSHDYSLLEQTNRKLESSIARRHTRDDYRQFLEAAGFEVTRVVDSTYHNAVMVIHAGKSE